MGDQQKCPKCPSHTLGPSRCSQEYAGGTWSRKEAIDLFGQAAVMEDPARKPSKGDVPLVEPRAAMKKRWTGGTAMKAMTKTIVAVKSVGIMMTPNHPM